MSAATSGARRRLARPIDPAGARARTIDHAGDNLGGVQQGLRRKVSVTLGHAGRVCPSSPWTT